MVNRGRSAGCVTCKERRIKCDETKPQCGQCQRLKLCCGGYKTKPANPRFKDQNHKFCAAVVAGRTFGIQDQTAVPGPSPLAAPNSAVPFFLGHYASMGRDMESARGFFEVLIPVYCSQRQDSALSLAVSAVATEILSLWRHDTGSSQLRRKSYAQAITRLRSAIQDRIERVKPATMLAVLTMQLYENIAAIYGFRYAAPIHHNGAISLLPFADSCQTNVMTSAYIRQFIIHTEISSATRQRRPLRSIAYSWIGRKDLIAVPNNPSFALDAIGVSVAELQASYTQLAKEGGFPLSPQRVFMEWRTRAKRVDEQLLAWAQSVPDHWQPLKLTSGQDIHTSIPTYRSVCEVYISCQVATIWNLWRVQRLLLASITLGSLNTVLHPSQFEFSKDPVLACAADFSKYKQIFRELIDSICHSVPFYLGNRTKRSCLDDFTDPAILLPTYNSLVPVDKRRMYKQNYDFTTSKDEHRRHVVARGPWQLMSPLSRVLTLCSEDHTQLIVSLFRPGQYEWICEQFLRVVILLHLPTAEFDEDSSAPRFVENKVEYLVKGVRKGAICMSGS
jgi:hypothetical protein